MGHYWREMDPEGAARHDARIERTQSIRKELEDITLDNFKVSDLRALLELLGFKHGYESPGFDVLDHMEKRVNSIKVDQKLKHK